VDGQNGGNMESMGKKAVRATGILTAVLLWFIGGVIKGSTGIKK
jgi:hypothetical protein